MRRDAHVLRGGVAMDHFAAAPHGRQRTEKAGTPCMAYGIANTRAEIPMAAGFIKAILAAGHARIVIDLIH
jgi:hypothetical protein